MRWVSTMVFAGAMLINTAVSADDEWAELRGQWQHTAEEAQQLLAQTPEDDWWARASLALVMYPHTGSLLEWERLAVSALRDEDLDQLRAAAMTAPNEASERLRLRLLEAWMAQDPQNLAPALQHALLAGEGAFAALGDGSRFERHDFALFPTLDRLVEALPEGITVPESVSLAENGVGKPEDIVWGKGMGVMVPAYHALPCLDQDAIWREVARAGSPCLAFGRLMERTSTSLLDNMIGIAAQRRWHETLGDDEAVEAVQTRREEIDRLMSDVFPDIGDDRELFMTWQALLVKHGELGSLRWVQEHCQAFDSSEACLRAGIAQQ